MNVGEGFEFEKCMILVYLSFDVSLKRVQRVLL